MSAATGLMIDGERTSGQVGTCLILQARAVQHAKDLALLAVAVSYWYLSLLHAPAADVRTQNVTAATAIANIVKSSLGPVGLDKMLVDELDVEHPAAKVLVEVAELQDQEVGDGTTSVVIVAAELLKRANELVKNNIHPTSVMSGYRLALKEAVKYIKQNLCVPVDTIGRPNLINAAKTS
eukprot:3096-Heterococcus_DN1.PRE.2